MTALRRLARHAVPHPMRARRAERQARVALGMPARHPERITAELRRHQEARLSELATELWPDDEYTEIIRGGGAV